MPTATDARPWRAWYGTTRWQRLRVNQLRQHPLCCMCPPSITIATVADHIKPHRGDPELFFDPANLQSLCATHHNATKQREEHRGHVIGSAVDGRPRDPQHAWNR